MRLEILEKISKELDKSINTEAQVLYVFAEMRKYLDRSNQTERNRYKDLYFYSNWVLHSEMDRGEAKNLLVRFETTLSGESSLKDMANIFKTQEKDFYSFVNLKNELLTFFDDNGLSTALVVDDSNWSAFKKLLVGILIDCPIKNVGGMISSFSYERCSDEQIRFRVRVNQIMELGSFKVTLKEK